MYFISLFADSPALGWVSGTEYTVVAGAGHLGQGCTSTQARGQRRLGPMFPPHVTGPRIVM